MKVVILCGGQGTRIRDVSADLPKPMIPIGEKPIIWHIMQYYASFGFKDFILCLGYKGQIIKDFFLNLENNTRNFTINFADNGKVEFCEDGKLVDWRVTLVNTGDLSMTGSRVKKIQPYVGEDENFMLTYGDGLSDVDLKSLLAFHLNHKKILTVTGVRPPSRFGEMVVGESGLVQAFNEKPQASAGRISGGFFVCNHRIFEFLGDDEDLVFEEEPIRSLVCDKNMVSYSHDGFWQPMDTAREFKYLNKLFDLGRAPWIR